MKVLGIDGKTEVEIADGQVVLKSEVDAINQQLDDANVAAKDAVKLAESLKVRAEKAERKAKQVAETSVDQAKLDELQQTNDALKAQLTEKEKHIGTLTNVQRMNAVQAAIMARTDIVEEARNDLATLVAPQLDVIDGVLCALTAQGTKKMSRKAIGQPMGVDELLDESIRPYMKKAAAGGGTGAGGKTDDGGKRIPTAAELEAITDPAERARVWQSISPDKQRELMASQAA